MSEISWDYLGLVVPARDDKRTAVFGSSLPAEVTNEHSHQHQRDQEADGEHRGADVAAEDLPESLTSSAWFHIGRNCWRNHWNTEQFSSFIDRQTCRYINRFIDQIWTFSGRLIVTHHNIFHVTVHGGVGDVLPDDLQRTLDDVMAAGLFAQISLAPGCGFQAALSTSGEGTAGLTQDDGAGDVHLWGGRWEWVCVCVCSCHNKRFTLQHSLTKV